MDPDLAADFAASNWNIFASSLLIAAWQRMGIDHYFVSPGYRDAPLIAALLQRQDLSITSCIDERAAAYQALGAAKALRRPTVLICTSGTAGANYFPAVMEAYSDHVPLLVITADRPFELVHAAAQQVVDQRQMYGRFAKKSFDFPAPSAQLVPAAWLSYARDLAQTAAAAPAGAVHINLPFAAPLDPTEGKERPTAAVQAAVAAALVASEQGLAMKEPTGLSAADLELLRSDIDGCERGLLLIGRLQGSEDRAAAAALASHLNWPCFADIGSGLKGRCALEILDVQHPVMRASLEAYRPDCVVHLGRRLVSRHFDEFLQRHPPRSYWVCSAEAGVQDPMHMPQRRQRDVDLGLLAKALGGARLKAAAISASGSSAKAERKAGDQQALCEQAAALRALLKHMPSPKFGFADVAQTILASAPSQGLHVFLGNSTAIRAFDSWCGEPFPAAMRFEANRGVSGIEGLLATTIGLARGSHKMWTAVLGDISLMHDLNSLLALGQQALPVITVVVNNAGGRIFETLPLAQHGWLKDPFISTPHSFDFAGLATMARIPYVLCTSREDFASAYALALQQAQAILIECKQEPDADRLYQRAFHARGV